MTGPASFPAFSDDPTDPNAPTAAEVQDNPALAALTPPEPLVAPDAVPADGQPVDALGRPASDNPDALTPPVTPDEVDALTDGEPVELTEAGQVDDDGRELAQRVLLPAEVAERDLIAATELAPVDGEQAAESGSVTPVTDTSPPVTPAPGTE